MVPDYNPNEEYVVGAEERKAETPAESPPAVPWWYKWRYGLAGLGLIILGSLSYRIAYQYVFSPEEVVTEPEETVLLERPKLGIDPGVYSYSPLLTITHEEKNSGLIYYTTDGTTPDEKSTLYRSPILIGEGTTVVRAVFVRDDGVQSEEVTGTYRVEFQYPEEPVFSVPAGSYNSSFSVTVTAEENCRVYYTTNGEEPGFQSRVYQGPIYIPPGLTVLQAVAVDEDGGMSGIVEAVYDVSGLHDTSLEPPEGENGIF